jgi:hypothetical protein
VVAYDDREIMLNGRKVVGPTGGTFRRTDEMIARFGRLTEIDCEMLDDRTRCRHSKVGLTSKCCTIREQDSAHGAG